MRLSTKGRYGVRIMLDIARNGRDAPVKIAEVAKRQNLTQKYTEQLTGTLAKKGLLKSVRGAQGGYLLTRTPEEYTLFEILNSLEEGIFLVDCVTGTESCARVEACKARKFWSGLYDTVKDYMEGYTLKDLIEN